MTQPAIPFSEGDVAEDKQTPEAEEPSSGRKMDAELKAMAAIIRLFGDLPEASQPRVMAYLSDRYQGPSIP